MIALDTNVLVRFLVSDDAPMTARARKVFEQALASGDPLLISNLVLLETLWVLGSAYGFTRKTNLEAIECLLSLPSVRFESQGFIREFVRLGRASSLDLSDILIGLHAKAIGSTITLTFDKKATRSDLFEEVS